MSPRELADAIVEAGANALRPLNECDRMCPSPPCYCSMQMARAALLAILRVLDPHMEEDWMMLEDVMEELGGKR